MSRNDSTTGERTHEIGDEPGKKEGSNQNSSRGWSSTELGCLQWKNNGHRLTAGHH